MRKVSLAVLTAGLIALASPVFAGSCPILIHEIEATLASTEVPDKTREEIVDLLEEGRHLHERGDYDAAMEVLSEAEAMLAM